MISARDLIARFQTALDEKWGYIYGQTHSLWDANKHQDYVRESAGDPDRENSCKYGMKWAGHWVTDCSGLFAWAFKQLGGKIAHGSNSIWSDYLTSRGTLSGGKRTDGQVLKPGTAVFTSNDEGRHNHIGLFTGDGTVIEAMGAKDGVTTTRISNKKWTHWGELKNVRYDADGDNHEKGGSGMFATVVLPQDASGNTVNMRERADRGSSVIARVPVGATVEVLEDRSTWCQIEFGGQVGWMMSNYLEYAGQGGESGGDVVTTAERLTIETALTEIEQKIETIRETLGRG